MEGLKNGAVLIIPITSAILGSFITAFILSKSFKRERRKFKIEHILSINNDKIKEYRDFFQINKKLKGVAYKVKNRAIPNWINVESYYRDEFILELEELLDNYEFNGSYVESKEISKQAVNILRMARGIVEELKERENYGSSSDEVEGESGKLIGAIGSMEKTILSRVLELSAEKNKYTSES